MGLGLRELIVILLIVLVIFGAKRLVSVGGDLGKALQSFRKGMREPAADDAATPPARLDPPATESPLPPAAGPGQGTTPRQDTTPGQGSPAAGERDRPAP